MPSRIITLLWVGITISFIIGSDLTAQETRELYMIAYSKTMALKEQGNYRHLTTNDSIRDVVNHPAFKGFSKLVLPRDDDTYYYDPPLRNVRSLMP